jgi:deoxyribonuclease-4
MGVCIDTAHLLAAGYDITTPDGLESTLQAIETTIGLAQVFVVHVNDSKAPLGSRVDRHEHIGKGHIGLPAFRRILNHPLLRASRQDSASADAPRVATVSRAFILETPIDRPGDDARNIRALWALVGNKVKSSGDGMKPRPPRRAAATAARRNRNFQRNSPKRKG